MFESFDATLRSDKLIKNLTAQLKIERFYDCKKKNDFLHMILSVKRASFLIL